MLRANERVLNFPLERPCWELGAFPRVDVLPGRFLSVVDLPPQATEGGIMLTTWGDGITKGGSAQQYRPDAVTVLSLGAIPIQKPHPMYSVARRMHQQIAVGDHLMVTPYVNRFKGLFPEGHLAHIGGLDGDEWLDTTVAKQHPEGWNLLGNWMAVLLASHARAIALSAVRGTTYTAGRHYEDWGKVLACGPEVEGWQPGDDVVLLGKGQVRPLDCKFFVPSRRTSSPFAPGTVFFRESSWQARRNRTLEHETRVAGHLLRA